MPARKTNEEFVKQLYQVNPDIMSLEQYKNAHQRIRCKCLKCNTIWEPFPYNLLKGEGCPNCNGSTRWTHDSFVKAIEEIDSDIQILGRFTNTSKKIEWRCKKCGHDWLTYASSLLKGHGCRKCHHFSKKMSNEEFIARLSVINPDVKPIDEYVDSKKPIRCYCKCGNVWQSLPGNLLAGKLCSNCGTVKAAKKQAKSAQVFNEEVTEINPWVAVCEPYVNANTKIKCKCLRCGYSWKGSPRTLLRGQGCSKCGKRWHTSFPEQAIYYYIKRHFPDAINSYTEGFYPSELDIFIPDLSIGIEYDGRYSHRGKAEQERRKYFTCQEKGITLIRVREGDCLEGEQPICDVLIPSKYGDISRFEMLDDAIIMLFHYLGITEIIDTRQDRLEIENQYYARRKEDSFGELFPELISEWKSSANGNITPYMVAPHSNERFYWTCAKCGHSYLASPDTRAKGHGCAKCAGVSRKRNEQYRREVRERFPSIRLLSDYKNATSPVDCICTICGYQWTTQARALLKSKGCSKCSRIAEHTQRTKAHATFLSEVRVANPNLIVLSDYSGANNPVRCRCRICNHEWEPVAGSLIGKNHGGCPNCAGNAKKRVLCIETGEIFSSLAEAGRRKSINHASISKCARNLQRTAGGYHWSIVE